MARKSHPVHMEALERRLFLDASQLTVVIDSNTLPAAVSDHAALIGKMSMTVSNTSGVLQKGKVEVGFLIANGALNVVQRNYGVLKSMNAVLSLANGKSQTFNFSIDIPAGKLADGVDTIYAIVVDPTNAFAQSTGPTLTVRPPIVTLSETENILKLPDSAAAGAKVSVTDQVTITNSGVDPSTDALKIALYATPDGIPAHGSLMTSVTRKVTINPGGKPVMVPMTIGGIPALAVGTYKLVTQVTQADGTVTTTDPATAPTVTVTTPTSGIHFTDTINTNTPAYAYEPLDDALVYLSSLTMEMSIRNSGTAASGEEQFSLFASTSPTFDSSAIHIGGPLSLDLGSIPHSGLRIFNIQFNTTADLNDFSGDEIDRYIFVQVTDPTGNTSVASLGTTLKVAGPPV